MSEFRNVSGRSLWLTQEVEDRAVFTAADAEGFNVEALIAGGFVKKVAQKKPKKESK